MAAQAFPDQIGNTIIIVITVTTFIVQIIGPPLVKTAVVKAKEAGLNITEEDLIQKLKVSDAMDVNCPLIYEYMKLPDILKIFGESSNSYYPVVNKDKHLVGIISVDRIREIFSTTGLSDLVIAADIMDSCKVSISAESGLSKAKKILNSNLEYLPVVEKDNKLVGFLELKNLNKLIPLKMIELHIKAESLAEG